MNNGVANAEDVTGYASEIVFSLCGRIYSWSDILFLICWMLISGRTRHFSHGDAARAKLDLSFYK